jgi:hypothetical protein
MQGQLEAFQRASQGQSEIYVKSSNEVYTEVSNAVQTLGSYPHWSEANVNEMKACFPEQ